jgi:hypothetical protein
MAHEPPYTVLTCQVNESPHQVVTESLPLPGIADYNGEFGRSRFWVEVVA